MIRKIIQIDEEKCNGCGACAHACHEGAIDMVNGKAKLVRENYCDGFGDCLPGCPTGAITFVEREAPAYDEAAVLRAKAAKAGGCPGSRMRTMNRASVPAATGEAPESALGQWPVQLKLVPTAAPYFQDGDILIAADCTAYAYAGFHSRFMAGKVTLIGCPKLDEGDYTEKLTKIFRDNDIRSVHLVRMEVPCCGGLERAAANALKASGKHLPLHVTILSVDGKILREV